MILKKVFHPLKVIQYVRGDLVLSLAASVLVYVLYSTLGWTKVSLPLSVATILGSGLAIFIGFRNNSSYGRWWEARTLWSSIVSSSKVLARQVIANADNAVTTGKATPEKVAAYKKEMVNRQIAFAHALRLRLRRQGSTEEFSHLLSAEEYGAIQKAHNIPNMLMLAQSKRVKEGIKDEILGQFDNISMEPTVGTFSSYQSACERIKNTPMLRQYHFFTRVFLQVFTVALPLSLIADFTRLGLPWLMILVSVVVAFVYAVVGKVGEVNEDPFENKITDVPMTAICNSIERDLKEMVGEPLPEKLEPKNGYLY